MLKQLQSNHSTITPLIFSLLLFTFPQLSFASADAHLLDLTTHWIGYASLATFFLAYVLVIAEEKFTCVNLNP
jgi:hypothetical protein